MYGRACVWIFIFNIFCALYGESTKRAKAPIGPYVSTSKLFNHTAKAFRQVMTGHVGDIMRRERKVTKTLSRRSEGVRGHHKQQLQQSILLIPYSSLPWGGAGMRCRDEDSNAMLRPGNAYSDLGCRKDRNSVNGILQSSLNRGIRVLQDS